MTYAMCIWEIASPLLFIFKTYDQINTPITSDEHVAFSFSIFPLVR